LTQTTKLCRCYLKYFSKCGVKEPKIRVLTPLFENQNPYKQTPPTLT
jgi:hypothetical protein